VIRLQKSFWWILFLASVTIFVSQLPGLFGNPIYGRLILVLLILLIANGLWAAFSFIGVGLQRVSRGNRKQVGEIFSENYEIINRSIIPKAWLKVTDLAELPGGSGSRVLTWLSARQSRSYVAYTFLSQRGWFTLGPTQLETGDVFGLFLLKKKFPTRSRLLVIPHTVTIQSFPAPFGILPGGRALRQKTLEVTPYAAGVREYVPGDPLKRIHWPSSASKQKLIVKEFEKDPLAEVWIFLDARESVHVQKNITEQIGVRDNFWLKRNQGYKLPPKTEEYAISIAASIAKFYINQKREVGLVSAGQNYSILPAERGERQLGKMLETLAVLRTQGTMPLSGLIGSQISHLGRGSTIIIITPSSDRQLMTVVMDLIQRGLMPVVILIDQLSFGGNSALNDLENQLNNHGILTILIKEGDDIKTRLESPRVTLDTRMIYRNL
jgi:uncharacterized protein (DUF58 family)